MKTNRKINYRKLLLELLVVFLGVTAGFILNNWRESRAENKLEQMYLQGFIEDITDDIADLDSLILKDSIIQNAFLPYVISLRTTKSSIDSATAYMTTILNIEKTNLHSGTYSDITNSGNLNILNNFKLKTLLSDYELQKDGLKFIEETFSNYVNSIVMPFAFREFDLLRLKFNNPEIIHSTDFSNVLTGYLSMVQQRHIYIIDLSEKAKELLDALTTEIK